VRTQLAYGLHCQEANYAQNTSSTCLYFSPRRRMHATTVGQLLIGDMLQGWLSLDTGTQKR
jgi:hypothetical protein